MFSLILYENQQIQSKEYLVNQNLRKGYSKLKGSEIVFSYYVLDLLCIARIHLHASQFKNHEFIKLRFMNFNEIVYSLIKLHERQQNKTCCFKLEICSFTYQWYP